MHILYCVTLRASKGGCYKQGKVMTACVLDAVLQGTTAKWSEVKKNRSATQLSGGKKKVAVAVPPTAGGSHSSAMTTLLR